MDMPRFDIRAPWIRAVQLTEATGLDAFVLMRPANLAYLTDDGPCARGLLTRSLQCTVSVSASALRTVRPASAATDVRAFRSEGRCSTDSKRRWRVASCAFRTLCVPLLCHLLSGGSQEDDQ